MFDHKVRLLTEGMARAMGRRKFLTQAGAAVFAGMAALASGRALGGTVLAQQKGEMSAGAEQPPTAPRAFDSPCQAPNGTYCSINTIQSGDGCQGAYCFQHRYQNEILECRLSYNYGYSVGCWTVMDQSGAAYWTCCDCQCGNDVNPSVTACGCARFSALPMPSSH
jgi:hypothetical protein